MNKNIGMAQDMSYSRWSIAGGTILSMLPSITSGEVLKTAILAAIGASVSYFVSRFLRRFFK